MSERKGRFSVRFSPGRSARSARRRTTVRWPGRGHYWLHANLHRSAHEPKPRMPIAVGPMCSRRWVSSAAPCWSHTRRHFERAGKVEPEAVAQALELIGQLYRVEKHIGKHALAGHDKRAYRIEHARPTVDRFFQWCDGQCQRIELLPSNPSPRRRRRAAGPARAPASAPRPRRARTTGRPPAPGASGSHPPVCPSRSTPSPSPSAPGTHRRAAQG